MSPVLKNLRFVDVANAMGLRPEQLGHLSRNIERYYHPTRMKLVKGKHRPIDAPTSMLKKLLRKLHRFLVKRFLVHRNVHGGAKGRSFISGAAVHCSAVHIGIRDLKSAYESISTQMVEDELLRRGLKPRVASVLSRLLTLKGRVPHGGPASGDALNIMLWGLDQDISSFAGSVRVRFERTYDDCVLSGSDRGSVIAVCSRLERRVSELGLRINLKKKNTHGMQVRGHSKGSPRVHNLEVSNRHGPKLPKEQKLLARQKAAGFRQGSKSVRPDSIRGLADRRRSLLGWINYTNQVEPRFASELRREMRVGDNLVQLRLSKVGLSGHKGKWWLVSKRRNEPSRIATTWEKIRTRESVAACH